MCKEKKYALTHHHRHTQSNSVTIKNDFLFFNGIKLPKNIKGNIFKNNSNTYTKHFFNWGKVKEKDGKIILNGFFQNYEFYKPYKDFIKKEISQYNDLTISHPFNDNDIIIHLRLKNYPSTLPLSFYDDILKQGNFKKIWIISDMKNHPTITYLKRIYGAQLVEGNSHQHLLYIINAPNIIMSQSTFCWWGAWLSSAHIIYFPVFETYNSKKLWCENSPRNIDLWVNEKNYKKIKI